MIADKMPEGEVALLLAEYLLAQPGSGPRVEVAIDGSSVLAHNKVIFDIRSFLKRREWLQMSSDKGKNDWTGVYERGGKTLSIHSQSGLGDVVCPFGERMVIAECKKGPLIKKTGSPERPLLAKALGQALIAKCSPHDIVVAAVPYSEAFEKIATAWRTRPLLTRSSIQIALVEQTGLVHGLDLSGL